MTDMNETEMNKIERDIDPRLKRKIEMLRMMPERDPDAVERGRKKFLAELDSIPEFNPRPTVNRLTGWLKYKTNHKENLPMNTRTQRFAFTTAAAVITILVLLFGGAGVTTFAAQSALPGDALYPVKTGLEQTRVILARDAYDQAQLHLSFAQRRLDEITELVSQGRYSDVELAADEFETYVQKAIAALETVMAGDPQRGAELSNQIVRTLLSYGAILKQVLAGVPEAARPALEQAILISQSSAGEEIEITGIVESITETTIVVSGQTIVIIDATEIEDGVTAGDQVKVEAILSSDGTLIAREIEFSGSDIEGNGDNDANDNEDDDNGNANDNDNDNDNANDNGNDNDDDNANDNGNDNDDDDNANDNDDNGNDNDDDNGNENDNDNGNDNEDDNGNDNGNDNDDDNENDNSNVNGNDNDDDNGNDNDDDNSNENDNEDDDNTNDNSNDNENSNDNDDDDDDD